VKTQILPGMLNYISGRSAKTMARCWRVTTVGGQIYGFTSHTRNLLFDGVTYNSLLGFASSAIQSKEGLSPDNYTVTAFLSEQDELDIYKGVYDHARVEIFLVNYLDLTLSKIIEKVGFIGQINRSDGKFTADVVGLSQLLSVKIGNTYSKACNARLGDSRCKVNIGAGSDYYATGSIATVINKRSFTVTLDDTFANGWFTEGNIQFTSGANNTIKRDISTHDGARFDLFIETPLPITVGVTFTVVAGCLKSFDVCRDKFFNLINHRGFPLIPTVEGVHYSPISSAISIQT
jgi:uncharacterized phage protein (TIGR02218 family)